MPMPARPAAIQRVALALAVLLGLMACLQTGALVRRAGELKRGALARGSQDARRQALDLDRVLQSLEPVARSLADDLSAGRVADGALPARLKQDLAGAPAAFRLGVNYAPATGPGAGLSAPYVERKDGALQQHRLEASGDYAAQNWFQADLEHEGWGEPHLDPASSQVVTGFTRFIRRPGALDRRPIGSVRLDLSQEGIRQLLYAASPGSTGYAFLLSAKGTVLSHPRHQWATEERTLFQVAQETGDPLLWQWGEMAARGERGYLKMSSYLGDQPIWLFAEPLPSAHWSLGLAVFCSEGELSPVATRRDAVNLALTLIGLGACLGLVFLGGEAGTLLALWRWQGMVSLLVAAGICLLWAMALAYPDPAEDQLLPISRPEQLERFLASHPSTPGTRPGQRGIRIPTGVYLRTLRFNNSDDVVATGMVWQRLPADFPAEQYPGLLFPNAEVQETREAFRRREGDRELVEYEFKATLREDFHSVGKYPFDKAVIRLPLWPRVFDAPVSLVPDLDAYRVLNPASLPGVAEGLVLPGWNKETSYFGFLDPSFTTTFGSTAAAGFDRPPELAFQVVLSRKFLNPFITALLPVFVVACLLFTLLMITTQDPESAGIKDFKAIDILVVNATLLFPVIYAQITLRSQITSSSLVYVEYFYFVMYALILVVTASSISLALGGAGLVRSRTNLMTKVLFWPLLLGSFFIISLIFLF